VLSLPVIRNITRPLLGREEGREEQNNYPLALKRIVRTAEKKTKIPTALGKRTPRRRKETESSLATEARSAPPPRKKEALKKGLDLF